MQRENIDHSWLFSEGQPSGIVAAAMYEKPGRPVNLPHDFLIETDTFAEAPGGSGTGYYGGGIGTYTKTVHIPAEYEGRRILLEFDGAFMNTSVGINGHLVTKHHYGYTPFHADITPYVKYGKQNRITVTVNNANQPNARWYTGAGIYRHVDLLVAPKLHIAPWGIYAHTSHIIDGTAFVIVETTVENHGSRDRNLQINISITKDSDGSVAGESKIAVHMPAGEKSVAQVMVAVEKAELWDIDSPSLYQVAAQLVDQEETLDCSSSLFGIRTISVDTKNGFRLNGRTLKLKGGCVHHDQGILGAASFKDSEYRKMKLHKDNSYNAIRSAHNPPSRDMLEACDRLGLLVIDEAFDVWTMGKNAGDYSLYFEQDWEADMEAFMLRDRNHPCIIMWSTGNEITERGGLSNGYKWAAKLASKARQLDPTRPLINSVCSFFNGLEDEDIAKCAEEMMKEYQKHGTLINLDTKYSMEIWSGYTEAFLAPIDVAGYNYLAHRYEEDAVAYPNRVICGTESKPLDTAEYWDSVERNPHVIGDFTWTSFDYLGEAGLGKSEYVDPEEPINSMSSYRSEYPWRLSFDADFDICGFPRPQLAYRKIVWGSGQTYIASHNPANRAKREILGRWGWPECANSWSWPGYEGRPVQIDVYSGAEEVELFLNGHSLGRQSAGKPNSFKSTFDITYEPGTLEAVSYTGGQRISSDVLKTAGKAAAIRLVPESTELIAGGQSLCYVAVEIVDGEGNLVPTAEVKATTRVEGAGTLAAFGTGKPKTTENYTRGEFTSYQGRLLAILRSGMEPGTVTLSVQAEGIGK
ncbi:MAG TPA: glycoside hydrolase family 2 protein [Clostridiales bacterium]|nr:glycoside hydrolase family 2 protein [Clostridiales bacterium]